MPRSENRSQGGSLAVLYSKMRTGDPFLVIPVPGKKEGDPVKQPIAAPEKQPVGVGNRISDGVTVGVMAYGVWSALKWVGAILLAPETAGASVEAAAMTP